jgi:hypothetical protein
VDGSRLHRASRRSGSAACPQIWNRVVAKMSHGPPCRSREPKVWTDRAPASMGDASLSRLGVGANDADEPRGAAGPVDSAGSAAQRPAPTLDVPRPHNPSSSTAGRDRKTGRPRPANGSGCSRTVGSSRRSHVSVTGAMDESAARGDTDLRHRACRDRPSGEVRVKALQNRQPGSPASPEPPIPARTAPCPRLQTDSNPKLP